MSDHNSGILIWYSVDPEEKLSDLFKTSKLSTVDFYSKYLVPGISGFQSSIITYERKMNQGNHSYY